MENFPKRNLTLFPPKGSKVNLDKIDEEIPIPGIESITFNVKPPIPILIALHTANVIRP